MPTEFAEHENLLSVRDTIPQAHPLERYDHNIHLKVLTAPDTARHSKTSVADLELVAWELVLNRRALDEYMTIRDEHGQLIAE